MSYMPERRLKHAKIFFITEKVDESLIKIHHIKTENHVADVLTKSSSKVKLEQFIWDLGLVHKFFKIVLVKII